MNNFAIDALIKQRDILLARKEAMLSEINAEIDDIISAIDILYGSDGIKKEPITQYDDQNPNYIKGSAEEI